MTVLSQGASPFGDRRPLSLDDAVARREQLITEGKTMVLTNGCFDLLHTGHLFLLERTSACADELWVAVNSDASVRSLKGSSRPLQGELERAYALLCLEFVDAVLLFDGRRLDNEIQALKPDAYAKGGDYSLETLDKKELAALEGAGAAIHFIPFLDGFGTTDLINRINNLPTT